MGYARWHGNALPRTKYETLVFYLHRRITRNNEKELMRYFVEVFDLGSAGRYPFLDDAQSVGFQEMPPIASTSPYVVFRVLLADRFYGCRHVAIGNERPG